MTSGIPQTSLQSFQILGTKREEKGFWNVILFDSKEKIQPTSLFNLHIYQPTHPLLFLPPSTSPATTPLDIVSVAWMKLSLFGVSMKDSTAKWKKPEYDQKLTANPLTLLPQNMSKSSPSLKMTKKKRWPLFTSPLWPLPSVYHCVIAMTGNFEKREAVAKIWSLMLFTLSQKLIALRELHSYTL